MAMELGSQRRGFASPVYPFTAIVGQEALKHALLLTGVDPLIGGVLALGERGTGKSTAVRALARLLPAIEVISDCPFQCDPARPEAVCTFCSALEWPYSERRPVPVVDLPLGVTEDRVTGGLDIEAALTRGEKVFEPGLLGRANRGFLYIDEVNLLEDHLIDLLLDVSASGVNVVEREGISLQHPARFVLIGSGNPEEGDLRPQLLDRFGLFVPVTTITDVRQRIEIVRRRDSFERDAGAFLQRFESEEEGTRSRIEAAQGRLPHVRVTDDMLGLAARIAIVLGLDGHRGELTLIRAARAHAAWSGRDEVIEEDVFQLAPMALGHRLRRDPLDDFEPGDRIRIALDKVREELG